MKLDLSRWNPFKFLRNTSREKRAESSSPAALSATAGALPVTWPESLWLLQPDPFRMLQDLTFGPFSGLRSLDRWFGDFSPNAFQPRIDVVDDGDALRITAELPGVNRQDLEVLIENDGIVLRGEKKLESKSEEKGCYRLERAFGKFERIIPLPADVDPNRAEVSFSNALLTIRLPRTKAEQSQSRQVEVK